MKVAVGHLEVELKVNYDRMWRPARDLERGPISTNHLQLIALCGFHFIEFMIGVF